MTEPEFGRGLHKSEPEVHRAQSPAQKTQGQMTSLSEGQSEPLPPEGQPPPPEGQPLPLEGVPQPPQPPSPPETVLQPLILPQLQPLIWPPPPQDEELPPPSPPSQPCQPPTVAPSVASSGCGGGGGGLGGSFGYDFDSPTRLGILEGSEGSFLQPDGGFLSGPLIEDMDE